LAVVAGFGLTILWKFARGTIDVKDIISEANVDVKGRVRYRSAGTDVATEFGGETTIETDPASSSEVRVEFNASADNVTVPVIVKLSA
jgi:hypothetical protein